MGIHYNHMKCCSHRIAILVLTTLIGCGLADPDPISVVCSPSEDGLIVFVPHPYECSKFFMCQGLDGIAMFCPGELQFDPNLHEALFQVPVPDKDPNIVMIVQKVGYSLQSRTIRPALVGVSRK